MKTLITATILMGLSSTAFAMAELPEHTIPGYGVEAGQITGINSAQIDGDVRAESLEHSLPGYGVVTAEAGSISSQPEVGNVGENYLVLSYQGAE